MESIGDCEVVVDVDVDVVVVDDGGKRFRQNVQPSPTAVHSQPASNFKSTDPAKENVTR